MKADKLEVSCLPLTRGSWIRTGVLTFMNECESRLVTVNAQQAMDEARSKYEAKEFTGAIELLHSIVEAEPDSPAVWANLALIYTEMEDHQAAIACYTRAIELGDGEQRTYRGVQFEIEGRDDEARRDYEMSLEADPDDLDTLINFGTFLLRTDGPQASLPLLAKATELDPRAGWQLSDVHLALGNVELAILALELALSAGELRAAHALEELRSEQ